MQKCLISTTDAGTGPEQPSTSEGDTANAGLDLLDGELEELFAEKEEDEG